jgi:hypothetical protein
VSLQPVGERWVEARIVYAGPADMPMDAPTFGAATVDAAGVVSVPITSVPAAGLDVNVDVEYAIAASQPSATSGAWSHMARLRRAALFTMPYTLRGPAVPAGGTVWLRGRATRPGLRPSAWVSINSVTAPQTPRLPLADAQVLPDGAVVVTWAPNAYTAGVRVTYGLHAAEDAPTVWLAADYIASASPATIEADVLDSVTVVIEPWSGWGGSAVTGNAGDAVSVVRQRPRSDQPQIPLGWAATSVLPSGDVLLEIGTEQGETVAAAYYAVEVGDEDEPPDWPVVDEDSEEVTADLWPYEATVAGLEAGEIARVLVRFRGEGGEWGNASGFTLRAPELAVIIDEDEPAPDYVPRWGRGTIWAQVEPIL